MQVDPSVLKALPEDLQKELQEAMAQREASRKVQSRASREPRGRTRGRALLRGQKTLWQLVGTPGTLPLAYLSSPPLSPFSSPFLPPIFPQGVHQGGQSSASTSHQKSFFWGREELPEVTSSDASLALSFSQVDPQVMAQLPQEIQREIAEKLPPHREPLPAQQDGQLLVNENQQEGTKAVENLWSGQPPRWVSQAQEIFGQPGGEQGRERRSLGYLVEHWGEIGVLRLSGVLREMAFCGCSLLPQVDSQVVALMLEQYITRICGTDLEEMQALMRAIKRSINALSHPTLSPSHSFPFG